MRRPRAAAAAAGARKSPWATRRTRGGKLENFHKVRQSQGRACARAFALRAAAAALSHSAAKAAVQRAVGPRAVNPLTDVRIGAVRRGFTDDASDVSRHMNGDLCHKNLCDHFIRCDRVIA